MAHAVHGVACVYMCMRTCVYSTVHVCSGTRPCAHAHNHGPWRERGRWQAQPISSLREAGPYGAGPGESSQTVHPSFPTSVLRKYIWKFRNMVSAKRPCAMEASLPKIPRGTKERAAQIT